VAAFSSAIHPEITCLSMSKKGAGVALAVGAGIALAGLVGAAAVGAYAILKDHLADKKDEEASPRGHGPAGSPSHSHSHSHSRSHGHSHGVSRAADSAARFCDAEVYAKRMETAERMHYSQPDAFIDQVIQPLVETIEGRAVIAEVGAGTGFYTSHLARKFSDPQRFRVIATDPELAMREYCTRRLQDQGATNVQVVEGGGDKHAGLPERAHVALLANVLHHLDDRVGWLRNTAMLDLAKGEDSPASYVVVIEWKTGPTPKIGDSSGPPDWLRMERSQIIGEFESAGYELVAAPSLGGPFDEVFVALVFSPSAVSQAAAGGSGGSAKA
jgi:SAM-dependent methyltransferase